MRTPTRALTILLLGTAAIAADAAPNQKGEAELARETAGLVAGKPVRCLTLGRTDGSTIIDGTAILYRGPAGMLWVNRPRGAEALREDDVLVEEIYGSQLCNLDQIKLIDRGSRMQRGFVGLNDFVPYTRPGKDARR